MFLAKTAILSAIKKGKIRVTPFSPKNIGPCSIDLSVSNTFWLFKKTPKRLVLSNEENFSPTLFQKLVCSKKKPLVLKPGQMVLGVTNEKIKLTENLLGLLQGRSRFARLGLMVHISSNLVQPGVENKQILEIINCSPKEIAVYPGTRICQVLFCVLKGKGNYSGQFNLQEGV